MVQTELSNFFQSPITTSTFIIYKFFIIFGGYDATWRDSCLTTLCVSSPISHHSPLADNVMWWWGGDVMMRWWWGDEVEMRWRWGGDEVVMRWWGGHEVIMRWWVMRWGCGDEVVMRWWGGHEVMRWWWGGDVMMRWSWGDGEVMSDEVGMWWWGGDVLMRWGCGDEVEMRWWCGDEVGMRWWCGDEVGMWWWGGDVMMRWGCDDEVLNYSTPSSHSGIPIIWLLWGWSMDIFHFISAYKNASFHHTEIFPSTPPPPPSNVLAYIQNLIMFSFLGGLDHFLSYIVFIWPDRFSHISGGWDDHFH